MIDSIPDAEKAKRLQVLLDRQREIQRVNYSKHIGQMMEVMVEGANPARGQVAGRSSQNKPVNFTCSQPIAPAPGVTCRLRSRELTLIVWSANPSKIDGGYEKREVMDIEVRIRGLMMDPSTNMPIVVLKDVASDTVMPIWVGIFEANAIAIEIEKMSAPRR